MKNYLPAILLGLFSLPLSATQNTNAAELEFTSAVCTNKGKTRSINVTYEDPQKKNNCKVIYHKETENPGNEQVLWTAKVEYNYCQTKAKDFVARLEGWGWNCKK